MKATQVNPLSRRHQLYNAKIRELKSSILLDSRKKFCDKFLIRIFGWLNFLPAFGQGSTTTREGSLPDNS